MSEGTLSLWARTRKFLTSYVVEIRELEAELKKAKKDSALLDKLLDEGVQIYIRLEGHTPPLCTREQVDELFKKLWKERGWED